MPWLQSQCRQGIFLNYRPQVFADCVVSGNGASVELLRKPAEEDWRVSLIDTGMWRNIGERLWAVRDYVRDEEIFLANYSDGLSDVDLNDMLDRFKKSGKLACFLATRPPLTYHIVDMDSEGGVRGMRAWDRADVWINSGFFLLRPKIFEFMQDGEELVVEPFERLAKANALIAYRHEGFYRSIDTLKDGKCRRIWRRRAKCLGGLATPALQERNGSQRHAVSRFGAAGQPVALLNPPALMS